MPSPDKTSKAGAKVSAEAFALALLLASSLQIMENLVPRLPIFPWLKPGLSYVVILPFLLRYGALPAFALLAGRNLLGLLYGGQIFSSFLIGTGSGAVTFLAFGAVAAWSYRRRLLGLVGVSVLLATMFNLSQLILVEWILIGHAGFYFQLGPLLAWSVISGGGVAYLIRLAESDLEGVWDGQAGFAFEARAARPTGEPPRGRAILFGAALVLLAFVLAVRSPAIQALAFPAFLYSSSRFSHDKIGNALKSVLAAWPLVFYLAWLHLFRTPGHILYHGVTQEGVSAFVLHTFRLLNLILVGQWLARALPLGWMRNSPHPYLRGFLIALPLLPGLFRFSLELGRQIMRRWSKGDRDHLLSPVFEGWKKALVPENPGEENPAREREPGSTNPP